MKLSTIWLVVWLAFVSLYALRTDATIQKLTATMEKQQRIILFQQRTLDDLTSKQQAVDAIAKELSLVDVSTRVQIQKVLKSLK